MRGDNHCSDPTQQLQTDMFNIHSERPAHSYLLRCQVSLSRGFKISDWKRQNLSHSINIWEGSNPRRAWGLCSWSTVKWLVTSASGFALCIRSFRLASIWSHYSRPLFTEAQLSPWSAIFHFILPENKPSLTLPKHLTECSGTQEFQNTWSELKCRQSFCILLANSGSLPKNSVRLHRIVQRQLVSSCSVSPNL